MTNLVSETQTVVMATIRIIDVINGKVDSKLGLIMQPICREIKSVSAGISGVEVNVTGVKVHWRAEVKNGFPIDVKVNSNFLNRNGSELIGPIDGENAIILIGEPLPIELALGHKRCVNLERSDVVGGLRQAKQTKH